MRGGTDTAARCIPLPPLLPPLLPAGSPGAAAAVPTAGSSDSGSRPQMRCWTADCTPGCARVASAGERTMARASERLGAGGSVGAAASSKRRSLTRIQTRHVRAAWKNQATQKAPE